MTPLTSVADARESNLYICIGRFPTNLICEPIGTVLIEANKAIVDNVEESVYVYLMKYFHLITCLKQAKDFKSEKRNVWKFLRKNGDK